MELQLSNLKQLDLRIDGYEEICACSYHNNHAVVWKRVLNEQKFQYLLHIYDSDLTLIKSCDFVKEIAYDTVRMYRNICILIDTDGGILKNKYEKNALVLTLEGTILKEFPIGMGINSVSISPQGTIWCGYGIDGKYKDFLPKTQKGSCRIVAAWNFFGELVYEMDYLSYDSTFGYLADCYSIYAKDNDEVYFFYYDKYDLCLLKDMEEKKLIAFNDEHKRPFNFTIKNKTLIVYFEPYLKELKSLDLYRIENSHLHYKDSVKLMDKGNEIKDYMLFINETIVLILYNHKLYRFAL